MIDFIRDYWSQLLVSLWPLVFAIRFVYARYSDPEDEDDFFTSSDIPGILSWAFWPIVLFVVFPIWGIAISFKYVMWDLPKKVGDKRRAKLKAAKLPEMTIVKEEGKE